MKARVIYTILALLTLTSLLLASQGRAIAASHQSSLVPTITSILLDEKALTFFRDADGDNYGDPNQPYIATTQPVGYVLDNTDCNDTNPVINPGATEVADGIDNNCNGQIDEGLSTIWYLDADGDGYGDPGKTQSAAIQPPGYVADSSDCDDTDSSINPGATEVADGIDNNCNGLIDEGLL